MTYLLFVVCFCILKNLIEEQLVSNQDDRRRQCCGENCSGSKDSNEGFITSEKEDSSVHIVSHTFTLEGLDCADCADSIKKVLADIPGVSTVGINFSSGKVNP
jgi:Zn2+/Cd2+-exporting ATPase